MSISASDLAGLSGMFDSAGALQAKDIANKYKLGTAQIKNSYKIAQMESKDRRAAIEAETQMNRDRIAQARAEMEQIGIPQMLINKFVAEKNAEIAQEDLDLKKLVAAQDYGLKVGELTGEFGGAPTQAAKEFAARMGIDEGTLTGMYNGMPTLAKQQFEEQARQFGQTFGLDVAKFKAQLASTPDTYFQSQQFNANDLPRLLGGTQGGPGQVGAPTPGVSTMGAALQFGQGGPYQSPAAVRDPNMLQEGGALNAQQDMLMGEGGPNAQYRRGVDPGGDAPMSWGTQGGPSRSYGGSSVNLSGVGRAPQGGPQADDGFSRYAMQFGVPDNAQAAQAQMQRLRAQWDAMPAEQKAPFAPPPSSKPTPSTAGLQTGDDRARQIAQVAKASPPSPYDGLNEQDTASLKLMESIYKKGFQGLPRGELERLQASGRMGFLKSAGNILGYSPEQAISQYQAYAPTQGAANLA
jgi:hypothetical protein